VEAAEKFYTLSFGFVSGSPGWYRQIESGTK